MSKRHDLAMNTTDCVSAAFAAALVLLAVPAKGQDIALQCYFERDESNTLSIYIPTGSTNATLQYARGAIPIYATVVVTSHRIGLTEVGARSSVWSYFEIDRVTGEIGRYIRSPIHNELAKRGRCSLLQAPQDRLF